METREMLEELLQKQIAEIEGLEIGSDFHQKAVADLAKLYSLLNEQEKIELESADRYEQRLSSERQAEADRDQREKHNRISNILQGIGLIGTATATVVNWNFIVKGFKFEETGVWSSRTMRELTSKMFKRLK